MGLAVQGKVSETIFIKCVCLKTANPNFVTYFEVLSQTKLPYTQSLHLCDLHFTKEGRSEVLHTTKYGALQAEERTFDLIYSWLLDFDTSGDLFGFELSNVGSNKTMERLILELVAVFVKPVITRMHI